MQLEHSVDDQAVRHQEEVELKDIKCQRNIQGTDMDRRPSLRLIPSES